MPDERPRSPGRPRKEDLQNVTDGTDETDETNQDLLNQQRDADVAKIIENRQIVQGILYPRGIRHNEEYPPDEEGNTE
jgi:hypothetical protein